MCLTSIGSMLLRSCTGFRYYDFGYPSGDLVEISLSSYGLLMFLRGLSLAMMRARGSHLGGGGGSSSISIGDLWPDIDKLDEAGHEGTSAIAARIPGENLILHYQSDSRGCCACD
jgi:hypothetical protein